MVVQGQYLKTVHLVHFGCGSNILCHVYLPSDCIGDLCTARPRVDQEAPTDQQVSHCSDGTERHVMDHTERHVMDYTERHVMGHTERHIEYHSGWHVT